MTTSDDPRRSIIAVVDDDQRILESLEILLESADYDVRPFPSATALLESGGLREIDCLISDVGMPVMDGFELARAIQAARPGLPVILITGRPDLLHRLAARLATSLPCVQEAVQWAGTSHGRRRCSAKPGSPHAQAVTSRTWRPSFQFTLQDEAVSSSVPPFSPAPRTSRPPSSS